MAASFKIDVKPSVLAWARSSTGLRLDEVARKIGVDEARVAAWEHGTEQPTLAQVRKLGEVYKRPLAVFLLDEPPADGQALKDFRSASTKQSMSPALRLAIREARERQEVAAELVTPDDDDVTPFDVVATLAEDAEVVAGRIRSALRVSLEEARSAGSGALSRWRSAVEARGVLVFGFAGVEVSEARGFALARDSMPAIGINNQDASNARIFTLMHELTHVALRAGDSLCDIADSDDATEVFCNRVAGAVLVPANALLSSLEVVRAAGRQTWSDESLRTLATQFAVSREVVLRRLLILNRTTPKHYAEWRTRLAAEVAVRKPKQSGGPSYSVKMASQLGRLYTHLVLAAHDRESITSSTASSYLGVKVNHFGALANAIAVGAT